MKTSKLIERLSEVLKSEGDCEVACDLWTPSDVETVFEDSTVAEREAVLDQMQRSYSADRGMSWDLLQAVGESQGLKPTDNDDQG